MPEVSKKPVPKWAVAAVVFGVLFAVGAIGNVLSGDDAVEPQAGAVAKPAAAALFADAEVSDTTVKAALSVIDSAEVQVQDNLGTA